jgi:hypothetical protein
MKIILTLATLFSVSMSVYAMQPKKNLNCDHARVTTSVVKVYSIQCPKGQMPYSGNVIQNPACYTTSVKNFNTGEVTYEAFCPRNDNGSYHKPFVKK